MTSPTAPLEGVITHAIGVEDAGELEHPALQDVPDEAPPEPDLSAEHAADDVPLDDIPPEPDDHVVEAPAAGQPAEVPPPDDTVPDLPDPVTADEVPSPSDAPPPGTTRSTRTASSTPGTHICSAPQQGPRPFAAWQQLMQMASPWSEGEAPL